MNYWTETVSVCLQSDNYGWSVYLKNHTRVYIHVIFDLSNIDDITAGSIPEWVLMTVPIFRESIRGTDGESLASLRDAMLCTEEVSEVNRH